MTLSIVQRMVVTVLPVALSVSAVAPTVAYEGNEAEFGNSGPVLVIEEGDRQWLEIWFTEEEMADVVRYGIELDVFQYIVGRIRTNEELIERLIAINGPYVEEKPYAGHVRANPVRISPEVERWRPLVEKFFPDGWVDWGLRIIRCESRGDPNAENGGSHASGLFQHLPKYWDERSVKAGWAGASIWHPEANVAVAAWLLEDGGTSHWTCKASR